jgi:hypothetical protein
MRKSPGPSSARVKRTEALVRLNRERAYEDELVAILTEFLITQVDYIEMDEEQRKKIRDGLMEIRQDSVNHSFLFNEMIQLVFECGEQDTF